MNRVTRLSCVTCRRRFPPEKPVHTCPDCGPLKGTLEVVYDYDAAAKELTRQSLAADRRDDMWRYLPLLPVDRPELIPPLKTGWTPLYRAARLEEELGIGEVWIKDDGRNPTASLKDRASAVAVVKALEQGASTVTAASSGNAAASWAAIAGLVGLRTVIFVPAAAPRAKLAQLLLFGAEVILVEGGYDQAFDLCLQAAERWGWYNRSTAINPYLGEGKKTAAFELCEQLDWNPPDYLFVGVGDGCILQGLAKGLIEFHRLGLIETVPRLVGAQAAGASPLVKAWRAGAETAEPETPRTLADSIAVGRPRDQVKALRAVRRTKGMMLAVEDDEILWAIAKLAEASGVMAEPAGAVGLAGLKKLAAEGVIGPDDRAAVMVTGHGLKDIDGVMKAVEREPMTVRPELEEVAERLGYS